MTLLRFLTAGESHGPALVAVIEGLPAGLPLNAGIIDADLHRRQQGYGRGGRMSIENDRIRILSGVRHGKTLGSPVSLYLENKDWTNWESIMAVEGEPHAGQEEFTAPRPGHADLAGGMKYGARDLRNILERASARETAARVAAGAVFRSLLSHFGVDITGMVEEIGGVKAVIPGTVNEAVKRAAESSPFRSPDPTAQSGFRKRVDEARDSGDTVGGVFVEIVTGLVPGLGSHVHWDRRLDARLAGALMSVPGVKGVETGIGFRGSHLMGSEFHDEITAAGPDDYRPWRYRRMTNRSGGLEGGMSTGEDLILRAMMKPIPTTGRPLGTVDIRSKKKRESHRERSDICAVPAAAVVGEAMCAFILAEEYLIKFGGDSLDDSLAAHGHYRSRLADY